MNSPKLFSLIGLSALTPEFLSGHAEIHDVDAKLLDLRDDAALLDFQDRISIDLELLASLVDDVLRRAHEFGDMSSLDKWLAPRLHFALRIPPRLAADSRFWTWLAVTTFQPYIRLRWADSSTGVVTRFRYVDSNMNLRNGVSRLWWSAEMTRNGPDYTPVERVLARVRTAQFALELAYSAFRPAAIAFANVCTDKRPEVTDDEKKQLSKRVRAYLSTTSLELLGVEQADMTRSYDARWREHRPTLKEVLSNTEDLRGPEDGIVAPAAVDTLSSYFSSIIDEIRQDEAE